MALVSFSLNSNQFIFVEYEFNDNNIFPKLAYLMVKCRTKYYKDIKDTITNTIYLWREDRIIWRALWDDLLYEKERFICDFWNL